MGSIRLSPELPYSSEKRTEAPLILVGGRIHKFIRGAKLSRGHAMSVRIGSSGAFPYGFQVQQPRRP
jgi:hypothetical protein